MAELLHQSWRHLLEDLEARMSSAGFAELQEQVQEACAICTEASQLTASFAFTPEIMSSRSPPDVVVRVGSLGEESRSLGNDCLSLPAYFNVDYGEGSQQLPHFWSLTMARHRLQRLRECAESDCDADEIADVVLGSFALMPPGNESRASMAEVSRRAELELAHARELVEARRWRFSRERLLDKALRYWYADLTRTSLRLAFGAWASEREAVASSRVRCYNSTPKAQSRNSARSPRTGTSPTAWTTSSAVASQKARTKAKTAAPKMGARSCSHADTPARSEVQRPTRLSGNRSSELDSAPEVLQLADENERLKKQLEEALEHRDEMQKQHANSVQEASDWTHRSYQVEEPPVDTGELRRLRHDLRELCETIREQVASQDGLLSPMASQRLTGTGQTTPVPGVMSMHSSNPTLSSDHSPGPGGGISPVPSVRMHDMVASKCSPVVMAPSVGTISAPPVPSPRVSVGSARSPGNSNQLPCTRPSAPVAIRPVTIVGSQARVLGLGSHEVASLQAPGTPVLRSPVAVTPREL